MQLDRSIFNHQFSLFVLVSILIGILLSSCTFFDKSLLTEQERQYLEEHIDSIKVLFDMTPPYAFIDAEGEYRGMAVDYTHELEKHLGVKFHYGYMDSWNELIEYTKTHDDYIVAGIARTKDRDEYMHFTNAFVKAPYVIVVRKGSTIKSMEDLVGKKVGTVRSYAVNVFLYENYSHLDFVEVSDNLEGLLKVSEHELDAMIANRMLATYQVEEHAIINLTAGGETDYYNALGASVSKDNHDLFKIIDKAVDRISSKKEKEIYVKWVNISSGKISKKILKTVLLIASVLLIVFAILALWVKSLRRLVNRQTQELRKAMERAEKSDSLKTAFLANMSHEIRTPMNGIVGFAKLLETPDLSYEDRMEYVGYINECGERMLHTINDLIDISRIETGQVTVNLTTFNIKKKIVSISKCFESIAHAKGIEFEHRSNISSDSLELESDESLLESIITNLLNNAIKFTNQGRVRFLSFLERNMLTITVEDTGVGIPEDMRELIFSRFEQANVENEMARQGSGLGLSITKSYVEILGGNIQVKSRVGEGSVFSCEIPVRLIPE